MPHFFLKSVYKIDIKVNTLLLITRIKMTDECTICLLNYNEETKKATECHHIFHQECIDRWLQTNNSCPLCRTCLQQHTRSSIDEVIYENGGYTYGIGARGSLMQLVAYGASDRMLTSAPRANQNPSPIFYSGEMYGMGSSIQRMDEPIVTLSQISQLDGRAIRASSHEEARPEQHQPSGSYNYSDGSIMQMIIRGAEDRYITSPPRATEQTQPRREQQHQQQQSRRNQIKYNNKQNKRR